MHGQLVSISGCSEDFYFKKGENQFRISGLLDTSANKLHGAILCFYFGCLFNVFHLYPMLQHCPAVKLQKRLFTECTFNDCTFIFWVNVSFKSTMHEQNSMQLIW